MAVDQIDKVVGGPARGELQRAADQARLIARLRCGELVAQAADRIEMAVDGGERLSTLGVAESGEGARDAAARGIPVDAVARLSQLRFGEKVGRPIAQAATDHGEELARHGVQRLAAHAERPDT